MWKKRGFQAGDPSFETRFEVEVYKYKNTRVADSSLELWSRVETKPTNKVPDYNGRMNWRRGNSHRGDQIFYVGFEVEVLICRKTRLAKQSLAFQPRARPGLEVWISKGIQISHPRPGSCLSA